MHSILQARVAVTGGAVSAQRLRHFALPDALVADYPSERRGGSRLLNILPKTPSSVLRPGAGRILDTCRQMEAEQRGREAGAGSEASSPPSPGSSTTTVVDWTFHDLKDLLPPSCHIVFNSSKVLPARMRASVVPVPSGSSGCEQPSVGSESPAEAGSFEVLFLQPGKAGAATCPWHLSADAANRGEGKPSPALSRAASLP